MANAKLQRVRKQNERYWKKKDSKRAQLAHAKVQELGVQNSVRYRSGVIASAAVASVMLASSPAFAGTTLPTITTNFAATAVGATTAPTYTPPGAGTVGAVNLNGATKAILTWGNGLGVGVGQLLNFSGSAGAGGAVVLSKVTDGIATTISGAIASNTQDTLIFVNPNGITVGAGATLQGVNMLFSTQPTSTTLASDLVTTQATNYGVVFTPTTGVGAGAALNWSNPGTTLKTTLISDGNILIDGGTTLGASDLILKTDGGSITATAKTLAATTLEMSSAGGAINITTNATQLKNIDAGNGAITILANGALDHAASTSMKSSASITIKSASAIGTPNAIAVDGGGTLSVTGTAGPANATGAPIAITVNNTLGGIALGEINAGAAGVGIGGAGPVTDANAAANNITANAITITNTGGVGTTTKAIDTTVAGGTFSLNGAGAVYLSNTGSETVAAATTTGAVGLTNKLNANVMIIAGAINSGANAVTLTTDKLNITTGSVTTSGVVTVKPTTAANGFNLAGAASVTDASANAIDLTNAEIANLQAGTGSLVLGTSLSGAIQTGAVAAGGNLGAVTFSKDTTLYGTSMTDNTTNANTAYVIGANGKTIDLRVLGLTAVNSTMNGGLLSVSNNAVTRAAAPLASITDAGAIGIGNVLSNVNLTLNATGGAVALTGVGGNSIDTSSGTGSITINAGVNAVTGTAPLVTAANAAGDILITAGSIGTSANNVVLNNASLGQYGLKTTTATGSIFVKSTTGMFSSAPLVSSNFLTVGSALTAAPTANEISLVVNATGNGTATPSRIVSITDSGTISIDAAGLALTSANSGDNTTNVANITGLELHGAGINLAGALTTGAAITLDANAGVNPGQIYGVGVVDNGTAVGGLGNIDLTAKEIQTVIGLTGGTAVGVKTKGLLNVTIAGATAANEGDAYITSAAPLNLGTLTIADNTAVNNPTQTTEIVTTGVNALNVTGAITVPSLLRLTSGAAIVNTNGAAVTIAAKDIGLLASGAIGAAGAGLINLDATGTGLSHASDNITINSRNTGTGGAITLGTVNTTGTTSTNNIDVIFGTGSLTTGAITTAGGNVTANNTANDGAITTTTINTSGGLVNLRSTTGALNTGTITTTGGAITLNSTTGAIGAAAPIALNSAGANAAAGGNVGVGSTTGAITLGAVTSSGGTAATNAVGQNAGTVAVNSNTGVITVGVISAKGTAADNTLGTNNLIGGAGGNVSLITAAGATAGTQVSVTSVDTSAGASAGVPTNGAVAGSIDLKSHNTAASAVGNVVIGGNLLAVGGTGATAGADGAITIIDGNNAALALGANNVKGGVVSITSRNALTGTGLITSSGTLSLSATDISSNGATGALAIAAKGAATIGSTGASAAGDIYVTSGQTINGLTLTAATGTNVNVKTTAGDINFGAGFTGTSSALVVNSAGKIDNTSGATIGLTGGSLSLTSVGTIGLTKLFDLTSTAAGTIGVNSGGNAITLGTVTAGTGASDFIFGAGSLSTGVISTAGGNVTANNTANNGNIRTGTIATLGGLVNLGDANNTGKINAGTITTQGGFVTLKTTGAGIIGDLAPISINTTGAAAGVGGDVIVNADAGNVTLGAITTTGGTAGATSTAGYNAGSVTIGTTSGALTTGVITATGSAAGSTAFNQPGGIGGNVSLIASAGATPGTQVSVASVDTSAGASNGLPVTGAAAGTITLKSHATPASAVGNVVIGGTGALLAVAGTGTGAGANGDITIVDGSNAALNLTGHAVTGNNVSITSGNAINQTDTAVITSTGTLNLKGSTIGSTAGAAGVIDANAINVIAGGPLTLTSTGTTAGTGNIYVDSAQTTALSLGAMTTANTANQHNVSIKTVGDVSQIATTNLQNTTDLKVQAGKTIGFINALAAKSIDLIANNSASGGTAVTVGNSVTTTGGGAISITSTNGGAIALANNAITTTNTTAGANNAGNITIGITGAGAVTSTGSSSITANGATGSASVGGNGGVIQVTTSNGAVTLNTVSSAGGAGNGTGNNGGAGGNITMTSGTAGNLLVGNLTAAGGAGAVKGADGTVITNSLGNATISNSTGNLKFGASTVGGALNVTAGTGSISQSGALLVTGATTLALNADNQTVNLTNTGNDFAANAVNATQVIAGKVSVTTTDTTNNRGESIQLSDKNAIALGNITTTDTLTVNANADGLGTDGNIDIAGIVLAEVQTNLNTDPTALTATTGAATGSITNSPNSTGNYIKSDRILMNTFSVGTSTANVNIDWTTNLVALGNNNPLLDIHNLTTGSVYLLNLKNATTQNGENMSYNNPDINAPTVIPSNSFTNSSANAPIAKFTDLQAVNNKLGGFFDGTFTVERMIARILNGTTTLGTATSGGLGQQFVETVSNPLTSGKYLYALNSTATTLLGGTWSNGSTAVNAGKLSDTMKVGASGDTTIANLDAVFAGTNASGLTGATVKGGDLVVTDGTATNKVTLGNAAGTVATTGNATVGGTLGVTGATTLTGATQVNNTLGVTGLSTTAGVTNTGALTATGAVQGASVTNGVDSIASNKTGITTNASTITANNTAVNASITTNAAGIASNKVTATRADNKANAIATYKVGAAPLDPVANPTATGITGAQLNATVDATNAKASAAGTTVGTLGANANTGNSFLNFFKKLFGI